MKLFISFIVFFGMLISASAALAPGAVIYGMVPCLEGVRCLKDATERLTFLQRQGIDAIWLSPIFPSDDESLISYKVTDYLNLNPSLGTSSDFKKFVTTAHEKGMKVIMDFVPNHTSDKHPYVFDIESRGVSSPFYHYYDRDDEGEISTYEMWPDLYLLNYQTIEVQEMMIKALSHWVSVYGIDGFRIDAAWGLRERFPIEFTSVIKRVSELNNDLIWIAEASALDPYYAQMGYEITYDWSENLGEWAWTQAFASAPIQTNLLGQALERSSLSPTQVLRFLNNNDTGDRFIARHGLENTKVAIALQFTVTGYPMVYIGDMSGEEFDPYDDPEALEHSDPYGLFSYYKKLASLRESIPALHSGKFTTLKTSEDTHSLTYLRSTNHSQVMVLLNFSAKEQKVRMSNPFDRTLNYKARDKMTERDVDSKLFKQKFLDFTLEPYDVRIIEINPL